MPPDRNSIPEVLWATRYLEAERDAVKARAAVVKFQADAGVEIFDDSVAYQPVAAARHRGIARAFMKSGVVAGIVGAVALVGAFAAAPVVAAIGIPVAVAVFATASGVAAVAGLGGGLSAIGAGFVFGEKARRETASPAYGVLVVRSGDQLGEEEALETRVAKADRFSDRCLKDFERAIAKLPLKAPTLEAIKKIGAGHPYDLAVEIERISGLGSYAKYENAANIDRPTLSSDLPDSGLSGPGTPGLV